MFDDVQRYYPTIVTESRLDHLQPFGCQVFYRDHRNPSKLAPRYKEGLLMGFVDGTHNYRIWDTKSNSVITSRDVVFTSLTDNK